MRWSRLRSLFVGCFLSMILAGMPRSSDAAVYNLRLVTDNAPDYTDIDSFVQSIASHCETPREKCVQVWRWGRRSRRQTSVAHEGGRIVWDPILHYNSYGAMNCGIISGLNATCFERLGYRGRYVQLGDHTVCEASWDDGQTWHLFDSSMSFFCYNHAGEVAGCEEIKESHGCELSGGRSEPGHYYLYHGAPQCASHLGADAWRFASDNPIDYQRTLANGASSYTDGYSPSKYSAYIRYGRRYTLNLRPCESYTRYWRPLDAEGSNIAAEDKHLYYRPVVGKDPDLQHGLHNIRGNGLWMFCPDLDAPECDKLFYDAKNIVVVGQTPGTRLHPAVAGQMAEVVFKVSAANVITSLRIEGEGMRQAVGDRLSVSVSPCAGLRWTPVWEAKEIGPQTMRIELGDEVAGVTECLVKIVMETRGKPDDVGINRLAIRTITQVNRRTLPKLTLGSNQVRLAADEQLESTLLWPQLHAGLYRDTVHTEKGVYSAEKTDGIYKATLGAAVANAPCYATWRVEVPTTIRDVTYGVVVTNRSSASSVALLYSFDGDHYTKFYSKKDGDSPFDKQVVQTISGAAVPGGSHRAHFKALFQCRGGEAGYGMPGIQDFFMRVTHEPRDATFVPLEVTYRWTEHRASGDVERSHTELVTSLPHDYTINVGGFRDPTMHSVRMNLQGPTLSAWPNVLPDETQGEKTADRYGYSDGKDVGPGAEPVLRNYVWGKQIGIGKTYTVSRPSDAASANPDSDGHELTNGKVIAPTASVTQQSVQPATAFWSKEGPVTCILDLGKATTLGGVRVCTHQPNADYCHPGRVDVAVSADGGSWQKVGTIDHNDVWNPPANYEPWEHDDNPKYDGLPAGGRLAYRFPLALESSVTARYVRFTCVPLRGHGMGLSELQVFERSDVVVGCPAVAPLW